MFWYGVIEWKVFRRIGAVKSTCKYCYGTGFHACAVRSGINAAGKSGNHSKSCLAKIMCQTLGKTCANHRSIT
ncbi:hypothetical protein D3C80_1655930 [compost metagenome]